MPGWPRRSARRSACRSPAARSPPRRRRRPRGHGGAREPTDRERASAFLDALFLEAGVPADAARRGARTASARLHGERHLWAAPRPRPARRWRGSGPPVSGSGWSRTATAGSRRRSRPPACASTSTSSSTRPWQGWKSPIPLSSTPRSRSSAFAPAEALYVGDLYEVDVVGRGRGGHGRGPAACRPERRDRSGCATVGLARGAGGRPAQGETRRHDGCALDGSGSARRSHARSACWSPSRASTATTAAPRWSPPRCATPAWRWSTPDCTRRPR